jgi:hypothetical protein
MCSIINAFDATYDDALFEESESPNGNISDECNSSHLYNLGVSYGPLTFKSHLSLLLSLPL